jgi:hypothetical protein
MILEDHERQRFAEYCQRQILSAGLLAKELAKHGNVSPYNVLEQREREKAAAYTVVARDLMQMESFSVKS